MDTYVTGSIYIGSHLFSLILFGSALALFSTVIFVDNDLFGIGQEIIGSSVPLLLIFLLPLICILISLLFSHYKKIFRQTLLDKIHSLSFGKILTYKFLRLEEYSTSLVKAYKHSHGFKVNAENEAFEMNKFTLRFVSPFIEKIYRGIYISENLGFFKLILTILWLLLILWTLLESFLIGVELSYIMMRVVLCAAFTVVLFIIFTQYFRRNYIYCTAVVLCIGLFAKFGTELAFGKVGPLATGCIPSITYILFNVD